MLVKSGVKTAAPFVRGSKENDSCHKKQNLGNGKITKIYHCARADLEPCALGVPSRKQATEYAECSFHGSVSIRLGWSSMF